MASRRESGVGEVLSRSSSADLSSPPQSASEPGSPSAQFANEFLSAIPNSSIIVNVPGIPPPTTQPPAKERKKPGRKPKASLDSNGAGTTTDAPKKRAPRKPKDPNAPVKPRKKRTQTATTENQAIVGPERLPTPTPKFITESKPIVQQDANFEVRPDPQVRSTSQNGKHEDIPMQRPIHSFFNVPPPPPPAQHQQPAPSQPQNSPLPLQYVLFPSH
jgi:hypothetical protein